MRKILCVLLIIALLPLGSYVFAAEAPQSLIKQDEDDQDKDENDEEDSGDKPGRQIEKPDQPQPPPPEEVPEPGAKIPPNCIWTLEGKVWDSKDIGKAQGFPGMIQIVSFEFQLYKLDGQYPSGQYICEMYAKVIMDSSAAFANAFAKVPEISQNLNINVSAYALRSGFTFNIYNFGNYKAHGYIWPYTSDANGNSFTPNNDQYAGEGDIALIFKGSGSAGGQVVDPNAAYSVEMPNIKINEKSYVKVRFVIEPNSVWGDSFYTTSTGSRAVSIYVFDGLEWHTGSGTLSRQPGGIENQVKFSQDQPKSLADKYGVDPTDVNLPDKTGAPPKVQDVGTPDAPAGQQPPAQQNPPAQQPPAQQQPKNEPEKGGLRALVDEDGNLIEDEPPNKAPETGKLGPLVESDDYLNGGEAPTVELWPLVDEQGNPHWLWDSDSDQLMPHNETPWNDSAPAEYKLGPLAPSE
jgi:hypothetical protein